jgi:hypothetical protein
VTSGTGDKKSIKFGQGNFLQDGTVTTQESATTLGNTIDGNKKAKTHFNKR